MANLTLVGPSALEHLERSHWLGFSSVELTRSVLYLVGSGGCSFRLGKASVASTAAINRSEIAIVTIVATRTGIASGIASVWARDA